MLERVAQVCACCILLAVTACAASEKDAPAAPAAIDASETSTPASKETTDATGVTRWGSRIDESGVTSLHGYDSDNQLRASYRFDKLKNEAGREVVRITRDDGPSVETFDISLSKDDPRYWTKNITDTLQFGAPLKFAVDDLEKAMQGTSLTSGGGTALTTGTRSLHTLAPGGGGLTNPSETHLICTNNDGDSCELASAGWVVLDCGGTAVGTLVTALGIASCPLVFGCVVAAGGAAATLAGAAACGKDIGQRTEGDPSYCKCDQK